MRLVSLCTGYGGLDLAIETLFTVEIAAIAEVDPAALKVCAARYPDIPNLGDINHIDWEAVMPNREPAVDVLTAGYP